MPYIENKCKGCVHFDIYYVIVGGKLSRLDYGFCVRTGDRVQDACGTCKHWKSAKNKRAGGKSFCISLIESMNRDLCAVKELLSDEQEA